MKQIPLSKGKFATVDDEDYEHLMQWKWYLHSCGYAVRNARVADNTTESTIYLHRYIMNAPDNFLVDHKDGIRNNCCKSNLRICTSSENLRHGIVKRKNTSSKYRGVFWHTGKKVWRVHIKLKTKLKYIGIFNDERDAAIAYNKAAKRYFGEFASINVGL